MEEMSQTNNRRLIEVVSNYEDSIYLEIAAVQCRNVLAYHIGRHKGVLEPKLHCGMNRDSVFYTKDNSDDDSCNLDFRYFIQPYSNSMDTYSWSENIKHAVIKNATGYLLSFNNVDIPAGETMIFRTPKNPYSPIHRYLWTPKNSSTRIKVKMIYFDFDGVMANMDKGEVHSIPGAMEFFRRVYSLYEERCEILYDISLPLNEKEHEKKISWVHKFLSNDVVVTPVTRGEKCNYCQGDGYILIDDCKKNIDEWEAKGGIGILYENIPNTVEKLSEIIPF